MALPDCLRLPAPRQPGGEVRAGRAYRSFAAGFIVLLTVAIALFVAPFLPGVPTRWHWPLWVAAAGTIVLTAPLRSWGLHRGLLSYYVHGTAVEGRVVSVEPVAGTTYRVTYRHPGTGTEIEARCTVYDSPRPPLAAGDPVAVLFRPSDPSDSILPALSGILPD